MASASGSILCLRKRALYLHKRELCLHARGHYVYIWIMRRGISLPVVSYVSAKEPCISAKEPYISAQESSISTHESCAQVSVS